MFTHLETQLVQDWVILEMDEKHHMIHLIHAQREQDDKDDKQCHGWIAIHYNRLRWSYS